MPDTPQSFENHAKLVPLYHLFVYLALTVNLGWSIHRLAQAPSMDAGVALVLAVALVVLAYYARAFPLRVQDRVIRLEERLRLQSLTPLEWHAQIYRLSEDQLIGLRFAGDNEVVELAKQALEHNLNRKQIKERIRNWRADNWRI